MWCHHARTPFQLLKTFVMLTGSPEKADVLMLALGRLQSHWNLRSMTVLPIKEENPRLLFSNVSELVGQYQILPFSSTELLLCVIYKDGERKLPAERSPICCIRKTSEGVICVYSFYDVGESHCHSAPAQPHSGHLALQSCHSGKEVSKPESARPGSHKGLKKHLTSTTWLHMPWNLTYMCVCVEAFNFLLYVRKELEQPATTHWPAATTSSSGNALSLGQTCCAGASSRSHIRHHIDLQPQPLREFLWESFTQDVIAGVSKD